MPIQDFGTPIIQAYLHGKQLRNQEEQQRAAREMAQKKLEEDIRQFNENLKAQQEVHKATIEHQKTLAAQQAAQLRMAALQAGQAGLLPASDITSPQGTSEQAAQDLNANTFRIPGQPTEVRPGAQFQSFSTERQPVDLGAGVVVPGSAIRTPEEAGVAGLQRELPALKTKAGFRLAEETAKFQNQQLLQEKKLQGQKEIAGIQTTSREDVAKLARESAERIANINGRFRLAAAQLKGVTPADQAAVSNWADDVLNLRRDINKVPKNLQGQVQKILGDQGFVAPPADLGKKLELYQGLNAVLSTAEELVNRLPTSRAGAILQKAGTKIGLNQEDVNAFNRLLPRAGAIVKSPIFANDKGNIALKEVERSLSGLVQPGMTREEGLKNINDIYRDLNAAYKGSTANIPPQQAEHYLKTILPTLAERVSAGAQTTAPKEHPPLIKNGGHYIWDGKQYVLSGAAQ